MKRYQYTCTLLSDVVISSSTATEGFNQSLDYIPGSKFLGIVAGKLYDIINDKSTLDLFHNGNVRFGDAYPYVQNQICYPVPFDWYFEKGKGLVGSSVYLHHKLNVDYIQNLNNRTQIEQARKGYFTESGLYVAVEQAFSIRSAYNRDKLRARNGSMFGYFSLPKGSSWKFIVEDDTELYADRIKEILSGKKRIGRSRSAEYGLVDISFDNEIPIEQGNILPSELTLIYALSNLCFYDNWGRTTGMPSSSQLRIPTGSIILWDKSQIRQRFYQTWNRKRHNRDTDRLIIEKGTVIAIKHDQPIDTMIFSSGIGSHRSEGFGKVIVNPDFLHSDDKILSYQFVKTDFVASVNPLIVQSQPSPTDNLVIEYLNKRKEQKSNTYNIDKKINTFIRENIDIFNGVNSSQWGTIRSYSKYAANWICLKVMLFDEGFGALYRGQSELDWRKKNRRIILLRFLEGLDETDRVIAAIKLSGEMAKRKNSKVKI